MEPARWKSERKKDWDARSDYLTLCGEAGWELLEEDGGLFYFRAKEGGDPAPIQTDKDMEWNYVWKKEMCIRDRDRWETWKPGRQLWWSHPWDTTLDLLVF